MYDGGRPSWLGLFIGAPVAPGVPVGVGAPAGSEVVELFACEGRGELALGAVGGGVCAFGCEPWVGVWLDDLRFEPRKFLRCDDIEKEPGREGWDVGGGFKKKGGREAVVGNWALVFGGCE